MGVGKGSGLCAAALVLALAAGPAGAATPAAGGAYAAEDASGQVLSFERPVERIVCLQTGCDEILADLGLLPVATAATPENTASPLYYGADAPQVVTLADPESVEEVASFAPDLIYVREGMEDRKAAMEAVAPVFVGFSGFESTPAESFYENLRDLGALTGRGEQAEAAIARFEGVLAALRDGAPADAADTRFMILFGFDPGAYFTYARGGIFCNLLEENGLGVCAVEGGSGFDESFGEMDAEAVLALDPDLIGYVSRPGEAGPEERTDPVWEQLAAVRDGRVYLDASDGLYCCGLRHVQYALELYAANAFPEAGFPQPAPYEAYDPEQPANATVAATPANREP
jgi:iron complex transport system substrate-binding protein